MKFDGKKGMERGWIMVVMKGSNGLQDNTRTTTEYVLFYLYLDHCGHEWKESVRMLEKVLVQGVSRVLC
jgi:hypothetical protein